jgi:hypothetical protein
MFFLFIDPISYPRPKDSGQKNPMPIHRRRECQMALMAANLPDEFLVLLASKISPPLFGTYI